MVTASRTLKTTQRCVVHTDRQPSGLFFFFLRLPFRLLLCGLLPFAHRWCTTTHQRTRAACVHVSRFADRHALSGLEAGLTGDRTKSTFLLLLLSTCTVQNTIAHILGRCLRNASNQRCNMPTLLSAPWATQTWSYFCSKGPPND